MNNICVLVALVFGFLVSCACFAYARKSAVSYEQSSNYYTLRARLDAYARMKQPCAKVFHPPDSQIAFQPSCMMISHHQHDILLGILKKIEAKYTSVAIVIIFALPLTIDAINNSIRNGIFSASLFAVAVGILIAMLVASLDGANHLGQNHFIKGISSRNDQPILGRELQRCLMDDMLRKEAMFHIYKYAILAIGIFLLIGYLDIVLSSRIGRYLCTWILNVCSP